ncbi:MAG: potassium/proton antiporter [Rhodospirillaceae bacterium]|nr:potassium/proton antiporter [Rhodospirillaceae bacterium]
MESISLINSLLLIGALLVMLGILSSLVATRFGAPLLLVFVALGMLAGEDGPGGIIFNDYETTYMIGSLALAVILFDGGLRTHINTLRGAIWPATLLATLGVTITAGLVGVVAMYIFDISLIYGLLLGSIVASTDAAAVFFLMHTGGLQLRQKINATLEMESATNDPVAVFLTMLLAAIILATAGAEPGETMSATALIGTLALHALIGAVGGVAGGLGASWLLNRVNLPGGLHPLLAIAVAVTVYAMTSVFDGSGFLAVYLAGMILGNRPLRASASIVTVNDAATWLAQIVMFLVLGLLVTPSKVLSYALPAGLIAVFLVVVARPVAVWLCLTPFGFSWREKTFISWVGLRGAVSIFLAAIPTLSGVDHADLYFNVAFVVVMVSLLVQGWTLTPAAKWLKLALPRKAAPVQRFELDLPGQLALEMVGYPVLSDSAVMNGAAVPAWARPAFVIRQQNILTPGQAGALKTGDFGYFLAPPDRVNRLDQLFAAHAELLASDEPFFGEFAFTGDVKLREVMAFYGLPADADMSDMSIADLFAARFEGRPDVGDHLSIGAAVVVVREVDEDRVTRAGLQLDAMSGTPLRTHVHHRLARLLSQMLNRLMRRNTN